MAESDNDQVVWLYNPSFALAVLATVLYGISFLWIAWLTLIKYRSWYFSCVVFGAALEVAGYAVRAYSTQAQTEVVSSTPFTSIWHGQSVKWLPFADRRARRSPRADDNHPAKTADI